MKKNGRLYVGNSTDLRTRILTTLHSSAEGGHSGVAATVQRIERLFYWPGLRADVALFVKECTNFQINKVEHIHPPGLLQPLTFLNQHVADHFHGFC